MSTLILTKEMMNDGQHITSIEIATLIGKPHNDLMKAIRKMEPAWELEHQGKFSQMQIRESLPNGGYRMRPCYLLNKMESLFIATKFNDVARAKLVLRWAELECKNLHAQGESAKMLETERVIMQRSDEIMKEKISLENKDAVECFTMSQVARSLTPWGLRLIAFMKGIGLMAPASAINIWCGRQRAWTSLRLK